MWLLISIMKKCAERCALHLYQTSLRLENYMDENYDQAALNHLRKEIFEEGNDVKQ